MYVSVELSGCVPDARADALVGRRVHRPREVQSRVWIRRASPIDAAALIGRLSATWSHAAALLRRARLKGDGAAIVSPRQQCPFREVILIVAVASCPGHVTWMWLLKSRCSR